MDIAVFGLGYVGTVTTACLSKLGHTVTGVDTNPSKVDSFNAGQSPVLEPGVNELLAEGLAQGRLRATTDAVDAVRGSRLALLCVGTPSRTNGDIDLTYIESVAGEIADAVAASDDQTDDDQTDNAPTDYVVVIRSTVLPPSIPSSCVRGREWPTSWILH